CVSTPSTLGHVGANGRRRASQLAGEAIQFFGRKVDGRLVGVFNTIHSLLPRIEILVSSRRGHVRSHSRIDAASKRGDLSVCRATMKSLPPSTGSAFLQLSAYTSRAASNI